MLVLLCLVLYAPGLTAIPTTDRDEARFAQATRQMLQTGDYLRIRFQDEARNKKPAGIYWLQAAAVAAFSNADSTAIWPYRLPSLVGATAAVLLCFVLGSAVLGGGIDADAARPAAFCGAALLACALGLVIEAHLAKTDATLLAAIVAAQGILGRAYVGARAGRSLPLALALAFWVAEAAAILLKGPPGPMLALVTVATLAIADRDAAWLKNLRPLAGIIVLAVLVVPWLVAIETATAGRFLSDALGHDFLAKLVGAQESHGAPPFYYLLLATATLWPGSLYLVPALVAGWQRHEVPAERFLLAWIGPAWVLLELVPTKLPHYVLPLYPALALLLGRAVTAGFTLDRSGAARWVDGAVRVLWAAFTLALAAALIVLPLRFDEHVPLLAMLGAALLIGFGTVLLRRRWSPAEVVALVTGLAAAFAVPAAIAVLPGLDRLWLTRAAAAAVARHPPPPGRPIVVVGYSEPSLVFALGTDIHLSTPPAAAQELVDGGEALVSGRENAMFRQALAARGLTATAIDRAAGFDYSNGQSLALMLYVVTPSVKPPPRR